MVFDYDINEEVWGTSDSIDAADLEQRAFRETGIIDVAEEALFGGDNTTRIYKSELYVIQSPILPEVKGQLPLT